MRKRNNPNHIYHSSADLPPSPKHPQEPRSTAVPPQAPVRAPRTSSEVKDIILPDQTVRVFYDAVAEEFTALGRGRYGYVRFTCPSLAALTHSIKRTLDKN